MWASLALSAMVLAPSQGGNLTLKNPRPTYGIFGQERKEKMVLVGDVFTLAFDIQGLQTQEDGKIQYSIGMELLDAAGKSQFAQQPKDLEAVNSLGGDTMPAFALVEIRTDTKPGNYTLKVTVTDRVNKATKDLTHPFVVGPPTLGFVQCSLAYPDKDYRPAPPVAAPGQTYWVNFAVVGFDLEKTKNQPQFNVEMRILDANGKPTLPKPATGGIDGLKNPVDEPFKKILPFQFALQLNRPGRYTIELKVTDKVSGKTATQTMEFAVLKKILSPEPWRGHP